MTIDDVGTPYPLTMVLNRYKVADINVNDDVYALNGDIEESEYIYYKIMQRSHVATYIIINF